MSNVLIGIIGVILFIGLALAGALFLGPRFQESTNNSKASAAVQAVSQMASAANMYRVQEGTALGSGSPISDLSAKGYLKSVPGNPTYSGSDTSYQPMALRADGQPIVSTPAEYIMMRIPDDQLAVCQAIARQSGQDLAQTTTTGGVPARPTGCFKANGAGNTTTNWIYAFAAI